MEAFKCLGFILQYKNQPISTDEAVNGTEQGQWPTRAFLIDDCVKSVFGLAKPAGYTTGDVWDPMVGVVVVEAKERLENDTIAAEHIQSASAWLVRSLTWWEKSENSKKRVIHT